MSNYNKIKFNPGKKLPPSELHEIQYELRRQLQNFLNAFIGVGKGIQTVNMTASTNSITLVNAVIFFWDSLLTMQNLTLNNIFPNATNATAEIYAEVVETLVTSAQDPTIIDSNLGIATSDRILYTSTLKSIIGTIPEDVEGTIGNNIVNVPIARVTGNSGITPIIDTNIYKQYINFNELSDEINTGMENIDSFIEENDLSKYKKDITAIDSNGNPTEAQYKRKNDNTLAIKQNASNPDLNGYYRTVVERFYAVDGVTVTKTVTYTFTFLENGIIDTSDGGVVS